VPGPFAKEFRRVNVKRAAQECHVVNDHVRICCWRRAIINGPAVLSSFAAYGRI
jgi:hypothetical protein